MLGSYNGFTTKKANTGQTTEPRQIFMVCRLERLCEADRPFSQSGGKRNKKSEKLNFRRAGKPKKDKKKGINLLTMCH